MIRKSRLSALLQNWAKSLELLLHGTTPSNIAASEDNVTDHVIAPELMNALQEAGWYPEVLLVLEEAGWYSGRNIDITKYEEALQADGLSGVYCMREGRVYILGFVPIFLNCARRCRSVKSKIDVH